MPEWLTELIDPNWLTAVAAAVTAVSVFLLWNQVKADHERSRRENSIEMMASWNDAIYRDSPSLPFIIMLVKEFDEKQCFSLWRSEEIEVEIKHRKLLEKCAVTLDLESETSLDGKRIIMSEKLSSAMRPKISHYLNSVEILATAWRHHTVDRDIIEEEFVFIFSRSKNNFPFDVFRKITSVYPSLDEILKAFDKKEGSRKNKEPIA